VSYSYSSWTTARFVARVWAAPPGRGGKPLKLVRGPALHVTALRPGSLRIDSIYDPTEIDPECVFLAPSDGFISNGKQQIEYWTGTHKFILAPAAPILARIGSKHGITKLIAPHLIFDQSDLLAPQLSGSKRGDSVEYEFETGDGDTCQFVVSGTNQLPARFSLLAQGGEWLRTCFEHWEFDVEISESYFEPEVPARPQPCSRVVRVLRRRRLGDP
jgi:hypothetical protein